MAVRVVLDRVPGTAGPPYTGSTVAASLGRIAAALGWGDAASPFGHAIASGARVVVKPNWVMHCNKGPWGLEPLLTHGTVVRAVSEALLRTGLDRLTVGDAPLQSCDFGRLLDAGGLGGWAAELARSDARFGGIEDFRRTHAELRRGVLVQHEEQRALRDFVLFDLGRDSLLEPVSRPARRFRVTQYRPELMFRTHGPGRHQYLVARRVIEADVVVNLPKLKTHRKAGLTNALKNLIGINGNKEYLPHHRVGGAAAGGDCYPGRSLVKRTAEWLLDAQNSVAAGWAKRALNLPIRALSLGARLTVDHLGVEGAWWGNDTVWRTCLDLNRILLYGRLDGTFADTPQRRILHLMDAVVAGQGDGPLAPEPLPLGVLGGSDDPAALDLVGARLLGYRPERIPTVRQAFDGSRWPISPAAPGDVMALNPNGARLDFSTLPLPERYPLGWTDALEGGRRTAPAMGVVYGGARAPVPLGTEEA